MTIDKLLDLVIANHLDLLTNKEQRTMKSMHRLMHNGYLTIEQSQVVLTILKQRAGLLWQQIPDIGTILDHKMWEHPFRVYTQDKRIFVKESKDMFGRHVGLYISHRYSTVLSKLIKQKLDPGRPLRQNGVATYTLLLSEARLKVAVDLLLPHGFELCPRTQEIYDIINSWDVETIMNQYSYEHNGKYQDLVTTKLGYAPTNEQILDLRLRYGYTTSVTSESTGLLAKLISREEKSVFVRDGDYSIGHIVDTLHTLGRKKILFVFDHQNCIRHFDSFTSMIDECGITDVGVYFRRDKNHREVSINQIIADKQLNTQLTSDTEIAAIHGKILPKFFLKVDWVPDAIVILGTFVNMKINAYSNRCDLVITYDKDEKIINIGV